MGSHVAPDTPALRPTPGLGMALVRPPWTQEAPRSFCLTTDFMFRKQTKDVLEQDRKGLSPCPDAPADRRAGAAALPRR